MHVSHSHLDLRKLTPLSEPIDTISTWGQLLLHSGAEMQRLPLRLEPTYFSEQSELTH